VNDAYNNGILWVNAMGNHAKRHYQATFTDNGAGWHAVQGSSIDIPITANSGEIIQLYLTWDAWPTTTADYNLSLYNSSGVSVASSTAGGNLPPKEYIYYAVPASSTYYARILKYSATTNHRMSLYSRNHNIASSVAVAASSLLSPADATGAMAVGAVDQAVWSTTKAIESFSSQGPSNDGRVKPEIIGPDGVLSYTYTPNRFFGTSAASPHVAGAAALVLSKNPSYTTSQLWSALTGSASDAGATGSDSIYGSGQLNLAATLPTTGGPAIATGYTHACALLTGGTVKCWGYNGFGQLGNGTTTQSTTPVSVSGITTAVMISAGAYHTCAFLADGTVKCWGYNGYGQLGNGTTTQSTTPVAVSGITTATDVSAGYIHTCARLSDGTVKCWGYNGYGQLGNGTTTQSTTPVAVSGITTATMVSAGVYHTCARLSDGTAKCWGNNVYGQLGNGTTTQSTTPVSVSGITTATMVSAGAYYTCARLSDGTAKCWGSNLNGRLGNGTATDSSTPVSVSGMTTATAVSAGWNQTCALLSDGTVKCWGNNVYGQLGNGTTITSYTPVSVSGISTATGVASGGWYACARLSDATAKCWGQNSNGQLGNGTPTNSSVPVLVSGIP